MNLGGENNKGGFTSEKDAHFTACKTSLFFVGDGFNIYNCHGQLVFRVDSYGLDWGDHQVEIVLMDASGQCLLTVRRKWASLHNRWDGYRGERADGSKPIFSVFRSSMYGKSEVTVEMYENKREEYQIDGSFKDRSCTIYDSISREVMCEIRRKIDISSNVVLGKDAFSILIKPGFDSAFAMGLILVLDQINADDELPDGPTDGANDIMASPHVPNDFPVDPVSQTVVNDEFEDELPVDRVPDGRADVMAGTVPSNGFHVDLSSKAIAH